MGGDVLFVGHASTLDACAQQLIGNEPRSMHDMMQVVRKGGVLSEIFNAILGGVRVFTQDFTPPI